MMVEHGLVKVFFTEAGKKFGFIRVTDTEGRPTGEEIFFHYNDGRPMLNDHHFQGGNLSALPRLAEPKRGDKLIFERKTTKRGHRASPWGFADQHDPEIDKGR